MPQAQTKDINKDIKPNESLMDFAQRTKGVFVNLLNMCGYNEKTGNYETMYVLSDSNLTGEKVRFQNGGQEIDAIVLYSVLGIDYKMGKRYRNEWKKHRDKIIADYKTQTKLDMHISSHNVKNISDELKTRARHKKTT